MELSAVETGVTASHWPSFIMSALLDLQIHSDLSICHLTSSDIILGNDGVLSSVLMLPLHTGSQSNYFFHTENKLQSVLYH